MSVLLAHRSHSFLNTVAPDGSKALAPRSRCPELGSCSRFFHGVLGASGPLCLGLLSAGPARSLPGRSPLRQPLPHFLCLSCLDLFIEICVLLYRLAVSFCFLFFIYPLLFLCVWRRNGTSRHKLFELWLLSSPYNRFEERVAVHYTVRDIERQL